MQSLTLASPAKVNLVLQVLDRRPNGYHELATLFHRISLRDTLKLEKRREGIRFICSHPRVPKKGNLVERAFYLLKKRCPFKGGVTVRLTKRIPVGGGLGGGSTNAASFLMGMNQLYRLGLDRHRLMKIGRELGADIPFFISGKRHAIGRGIGDQIQPIRFRRRLWFLLFPSGKGLSTRKVYRGTRLKGRLTGVDRRIRIASAFLEKGDLGNAARFLQNDLAESAEKLRPSLKRTRESLSGIQLGMCQMSGSGPTLFVIFISQQKAKSALRRFRACNRVGRVLLCHSD